MLVLVKIVLFFVFSGVVGLGRQPALLLDDGPGAAGRNLRRYPVLAFVLCLLMAYCAEEFFGVADITGAYVAGLVISCTPKATYIQSKYRAPELSAADAGVFRQHRHQCAGGRHDAACHGRVLRSCCW